MTGTRSDTAGTWLPQDWTPTARVRPYVLELERTRAAAAAAAAQAVASAFAGGGRRGRAEAGVDEPAARAAFLKAVRDEEPPDVGLLEAVIDGLRKP